MPESKSILLSWKIPEHIRHQRGRLWYFLTAIVGGFLIIYGVLTNNFLFALIVILFGIVTGLLHMQEPPIIDFAITSEGVNLGGKTIEYKDISSFWLIIKPEEQVKSLHLRTKIFWYPLLSVPLEDTDPEAARSVLSKYIQEDTSEKEEPLLETLSRRLKF